MRIVGGSHKGRRLIVPKDRDIRPTSDKVRGAIFNALEARGAVRDAHVLDAFCGSGALGLEALSRGAALAHFWDNDPYALALARENAAVLGLLEHAVFTRRNAVQFSEAWCEQPFSLVLLDPPYRKGYIRRVLESLVRDQCLADGAYCVLEMEAGHDPVLPAVFSVHFDKIYGDTRVIIASYHTGSS